MSRSATTHRWNATCTPQIIGWVSFRNHWEALEFVTTMKAGNLGFNNFLPQCWSCWRHGCRASPLVKGSRTEQRQTAASWTVRAAQLLQVHSNVDLFAVWLWTARHCFGINSHKTFYHWWLYCYCGWHISGSVSLPRRCPGFSKGTDRLETEHPTLICRLCLVN